MVNGREEESSMQTGRMRDNADFWAGVMFVAFGAAAIFLSRDYPMGSAMRMGPGYFPHYLGILMVLMGLVIAVKGLLRPTERIGSWAFRPLVMLGLGVIVFGLAIETVGFVLALAALILLSTLAGREFRPLEVIVLILVLIGGAIAIFIYGIGLPYQLFWWY
jgi:uncharacterized membrane protein YidH (DUF202 family)